ncbi:MAG TPA: CoA-acylating methylmalonate-semialdehyde dehydrogenase [Thermoleophilaceae bacterium]|nr:CoA-acylating methylmalonate-semialdehyde dehydrogenase [Thermoleophilaceae bacterium]
MPNTSSIAPAADSVTRSDDAAAPRLGNFVGGRWVELPEREAIDCLDPASGELIATVPLSGADDVDRAVRAARDAFPGWRATSPLRRARALFGLRDLLTRHADELAELVTRDMGKTTADARAEVGRGIESVEAACAAPHMLKGENLEGVGTGVDVELVRQPVGVVAGITPFNFPAMIPLWFLPYAVVCGNTVVMKPSEADPLTSVRMFELIADAELFPPGVVNLVNGAHEAVDGLLDHPGVDAISFVGSAKTARYIYERAATRGKRVQALGGAKNAMVVMPDADPELMLDGVLSSAFGAAGQRCLAGSIAVLVGTPEEQDRARERIVAGAQALRTGPGADPQTDVCPLVSAQARERLEGEIEALAAEAEIVLDGRGASGAGGTELRPTIVDRAPLDSRAVTEELFGPVLTLLRARDLDDAIEIVNSSRYGNASVIFTSSGQAARSYRYSVEAGMVGVNVGVAAPVAWFPFAGWKDSFDGDLHANGPDAFEFYTRKKVVTSRWA